MLPLNPPPGISGFDAFKKSILLLFNDGDRIWLKFGHNQFVYSQVNLNGIFPATKTKLKTQNIGISRYDVGIEIDTFKYLDDKSRHFDGGVFFIPGKPSDYPLKDFCIESDILSAEFDEGTADDQWNWIIEFSTISGLIPTVILTSGGKSYHVHWKLDRKIPIIERTNLQRLISIILGSDPAVTNPHQPMRIPGFYRKEKGNYQSLIHADETAVYSVEQIINGLKILFQKKGLIFTEQTLTDYQFKNFKRIRKNLTIEAWEDILANPEKPQPIRHQKIELTSKNELTSKTEPISKIQPFTHKTNNIFWDKFNNEVLPLLDAWSIFNEWNGHNYKDRGNGEYDGCCHLHDSKSQTSFSIDVNKKLWHCRGGCGGGGLIEYIHSIRTGNTNPSGKEKYDIACELYRKAGVEIPKEQQKPSDYARSYLAALSPERADDYEQWINVGIALRSVGDPYLLDDWIEWSKQSSKFTPGECERKWGGFKPGNLTLGTLGHWAKLDGWESPANQKPQSEVIDVNDWAWNNWVKSRKLTGKKISEKYFKMPDNLPEKGVIFCGKSKLGTGKTTATTNHCKKSNKGSRNLGFINNLLYQTVARFEEAGLRAYHLHSDDSFSLLSDKDSHIFYCLPSIVNTAPSHYEDCDLIIDEIVSVLMAAIDGGTLSDFQGYALEMFRLALLHCDRAFLMDGNLRDIDIELIAKLCPEKQIIVIDNEHKPEPHNIKFIQSVDVEGEIKKADKSPLIKAMLSAECPFIVCDSLERTKVLGALLRQSGKRGYVLNSETSGEEWAKEFLANPTEFLKKYNPDFFAMSPSGSAGLDIWWDKITHKFTFISGVLDVNGINQLMFRSRDNKPHYVFCPEKVNVKDRVTPDTYSVKKYREHIDKYINQSASLAGEDNEFSKVINQKLDETIGRSSDLWWEYSTKLGALDRFEKDNFQRCLIYTLEQSGHNVEVVQWESCQEVKKEVKEAKERIQITESKGIFNVESIPYEDAVKMSKSGTKNITELYQVRKAFLLHKLPGIQNSEVWGDEFILKYWVKNKDEISKLERFWMLQNYEVSKLRHEVDWYFHSERNYVFKGMFRKSHHSTIWALKQLGIEKFLSGSWHKESPEIREVVAKGYQPDIMLALGFSPGKEKPKDKHVMEYINKCLDLIGSRLTKSSKVTIGNQRVNTFAVKSDSLDCENRLAILKAIEKRFTEWLEKNQHKANWLGDKVEADCCPQTGVLYTQGGCGDTSPNEVITHTPRHFEPIYSTVPSAKIDRSDTHVDRSDTHADRLESSPESANAPLETLEPSEPHEYERIAAKLAASAHSLEMLKLIIAEYGWEKCDESTIFAPIQVRSHLNKCLKKIALEPML